MEIKVQNNLNKLDQLFNDVSRPMRRKAKQALKCHETKADLIAKKHFSKYHLNVDETTKGR